MFPYLVKCEDQTCNGYKYPGDTPACPKCNAPRAFASPAQIDERFWGYDIETYPGVFTMTLIHANTGKKVRFQITPWQNDYDEMTRFLHGMGQSGAIGVGFNNIGFDYPVVHHALKNPGCTGEDIYQYAMSIIKSDSKFGVTIWERDRVFQQIDLFKICHFDNKARGTSLKALEVAMHSDNVSDLPYPPGTVLTQEQVANVLIPYNDKDVEETIKFLVRNLDKIEFREELTKKYSRDFMNHNDTKIGKDFFIMELEKSGVPCYGRDQNNRRYPLQTIREQIALKDVIFPTVRFERPEFNEVLEKFKSKTLKKAQLDEKTEGNLTTKGVFSDLETTIDGFTYVYGVGGIHASVESQIITSSDTHQIVDVDVKSFYPKLAIVNRLYPRHLSEGFCDIYLDVYNERDKHPSGTPTNRTLKLALNGVYGDSNNVYSPFYDPFYTMSITINGQLLLTMLAEQLIKTPGLKMIQCNTDGVTVLCPRIYLDHMRSVCQWWEQLTGLVLEEALYKRMSIRDVNNYVAEYENGKVKRKGAYEWAYEWHQDPSAIIVPQAAEAFLVHGTPIREFITSHRDPFDFMLRAKVPRASTLELRWPEIDVAIPLQNTTRYFVSRNGGSLVKVSPPTGEPGSWKRRPKVPDQVYNAVIRENAGKEGVKDSTGVVWDERIHTKNMSKHDTREMGICVGNKVTECARQTDFDWSRLDYEYYITQAQKLVDPLVHHQH
ncbi:MAG: hypothetical protein [Caudoviricetes sp.]|nr:MAG: hypothetical protein [Caudoviricetes sp.]